MKTRIIYLLALIMITGECKKESPVIIPTETQPTAILISTKANLLDTVWSAPKRYMHFFITFDVVAGDSDMYFSQVPIDFGGFVNIRGIDTVHLYTPYRPMILTSIPETESESDVYKVNAQDTARITYFGIVIAHGSWTDFYMQAYKFPYSKGVNDGTYESSIAFTQPFTTDRPH